MHMCIYTHMCVFFVGARDEPQGAIQLQPGAPRASLPGAEREEVAACRLRGCPDVYHAAGIAGSAACHEGPDVFPVVEDWLAR